MMCEAPGIVPGHIFPVWETLEPCISQQQSFLRSIYFAFQGYSVMKLDSVGSTVRYEMMKLCTGSVQDTTRRQQLVIDDTGSVEGIFAFIYCKK